MINSDGKNKESESGNIKLENEIKGLEELNKRLLSLININAIISSSLDKKEVLKSILNQTKGFMQCEKSSVLLVNPDELFLYFEALSDENEMKALSEIKLQKGEGIAGTVWETGKPLLINNASEDKRLSKKADKKLSCITKSLIAAPLFVNDRIIGVMEAINKSDNTDFSESDLIVFKSLSYLAANAIHNARLYEMAITDGMTKLYIHRYFCERLKEEINRSIRHKRDVSMIMFDIDHFKKINDTYGHQLGDEFLIKTAMIIKGNCRKSDIPARYGGEEFSVILPETNIEGAYIFAERIRKAVEGTEIHHKDNIIKITISAGISSLDYNRTSDAGKKLHTLATGKELYTPAAGAFIEMADKALYFSKQHGRNRVSVYNVHLDRPTPTLLHPS